MDNSHVINLTEPLHESITSLDFLGKKIRILTLNCFLRPPPIKNNKCDYKEERTKFIIENIFSNYDIICFQEVFGALSSRKSRILKEAVKQGFVYYEQAPAPGFWSTQFIDGGLVILSRFPIVRTDFQAFKNGVVPDLFSMKGILYCKLEIHGESVHLFTAHLQASYPTTNQRTFLHYRQVRRHQMKIMEEFIAKNSKPKELTLVLGDMNVDGKERQKPALFDNIECQDDYDMLVSHLSGGNLGNIMDVVRSKYGYSPATYGVKLPNGEPEETVLSHRNENTRDTSIDHIFAMNLNESKFAIENSDTRVEPFYVKGMPFNRVSDHYGVQTSFYLKSA